MKYAVVIVTYNRCALLQECIQAVLHQTVAPQYVYVINNASTDDTQEYLDSVADSRVIVKSMPTNLGGAGGFYQGLRMVKESDADWCIIIDDDAILNQDFWAQIEHQIVNQNQMQAQNQNQNQNQKQAQNQAQNQILAYAGTVKTDGKIQTEHRQVSSNPWYQFQRVSESSYQQEVFPCDVASFCGLVIHHSLLDQIGLPEKDYFIWYDDTEYCLRIRRYSQILVVPAAILNHKVKAIKQEHPRHYTWKDYYGIRNRIHMVKKHGGRNDQIGLRLYIFLHYQFRNWLFDLLHKNGQDWKYERKICKMAIRDAYVTHKMGKNDQIS